MDYTGKIISKNPPQPTQASASGVWTLDEAAAAVKNNSWPIPGVPNPISKSLRFNSADSAYLSRTTWGTPTNRKKGTFSFWVKRSELGSSSRYLVYSYNGSASNSFGIYFVSDNTLEFQFGGSSAKNIRTSAVFRDPSAWYHLVFAWDTTDATAANRTKIYVNNVEQTLGTTNYPSQNDDAQFPATTDNYIGYTSSITFGGYLTEINFIDGSALTPSSFGAADPNTGEWQPQVYHGAYGTNGFYLRFANNTGTTSTTLGLDSSGNGNNWTPNNFSVTAGAGNDSLVDVPSSYGTDTGVGGEVRGNYATLNPLNLPPSNNTLSNGNLDNNMNVAGQWGAGTSTVSVSSGKWYAEFKVNTVSGTPSFAVGISTTQYQNERLDGSGYYGRFWNFSYGYAYISDGRKYTNNSDSAYGATYTSGDVIGVALDLDAGTVVFYKNGVSQGTAYSSLSGTFTINASAIGQQSRTEANFGQRPFAYTAPSGFKALCTQNLPTPTIGATATTRADDYFNTVLWTGTGASLNVTGVGFQPDFVWNKSRSNAQDHRVFDVLRGTSNALFTNSTLGDYTESGITSFNSDGFTIGSAGNTNGYTYVSWNWKANGAGSSNTAGTITSTVSVNTTSGFSIVTYTGTGANATVGHGLGVAPSMLIIKRRDTTGTWRVGHSSLTSWAYRLNLDETADAAINAGAFNSTAPTSTVFSVGTDTSTNASTGTYVAYCFAPIAGYSAFGSYTGNGSTDGPFVYTGFRPRYVLMKCTSAASQWLVVDTARSTYNVIGDAQLYPNSSSAQGGGGWGNYMDIVSNGFKLRGFDNDNFNSSADTYIYAAFAEFPFKFARAR